MCSCLLVLVPFCRTNPDFALTRRVGAHVTSSHLVVGQGVRTSRHIAFALAWLEERAESLLGGLTERYRILERSSLQPI